MDNVVLKVIKNFKNEQVSILEGANHGFFLFKVGENFICVRHAGNVVLDSDWIKKTNAAQKYKLKDFLGGMYISEVKKEIKDGNFKITDLNAIIC